MASLISATQTSPAPGRAGFPALLVSRGLLTAADLATAEAHAIRGHLELADAVVALSFVSEADSYAALAVAAGTFVSAIDAAMSSELAVQLVPERLARRHFVVPLEMDNRTLTYATCEPFRVEAERDLGFASGRRTVMTVATRSAVLSSLDRCYPKLRYLDVLAERLRVASIEYGDGTTAKGVSSVIDICNQIIGRAVEVGASHVYMESGTQSGTIRYQVGAAIESMPALAASVSHPIRDRFKIMARVASAIRHKAQDGVFRVTVKGQPTEVRLSAQPVPGGGERIVMEIAGGQSGAAVFGTGARAAAKPPARPRVLVAEDEPITRMLVKLLLEREHFDVLEAVNGEQAAEIALRERPDLMLIDLNMPVMDGFQAIHFVRQTLTMSALPIIVLTAEDGQSVERRVLQLGANDYILKPFEPAVLLARVNAVFSRRTMMAA